MRLSAQSCETKASCKRSSVGQSKCCYSSVATSSSTTPRDCLKKLPSSNTKRNGIASSWRYIGSWRKKAGNENEPSNAEKSLSERITQGDASTRKTRTVCKRSAGYCRNRLTGCRARRLQRKWSSQEYLCKRNRSTCSQPAAFPRLFLPRGWFSKHPWGDNNKGCCAIITRWHFYRFVFEESTQ